MRSEVRDDPHLPRHAVVVRTLELVGGVHFCVELIDFVRRPFEVQCFHAIALPAPILHWQRAGELSGGTEGR